MFPNKSSMRSSQQILRCDRLADWLFAAGWLARVLKGSAAVEVGSRRTAEIAGRRAASDKVYVNLA